MIQYIFCWFWIWVELHLAVCLMHLRSPLPPPPVPLLTIFYLPNHYDDNIIVVDTPAIHRTVSRCAAPSSLTPPPRITLFSGIIFLLTIFIDKLDFCKNIRFFFFVFSFFIFIFHFFYCGHFVFPARLLCLTFFF